MIEFRLTAIALSLVAIPAALLACGERLGGSPRSALRLAVNFFSVWAAIVLVMFLEETYLDYKLATFDLDGDGIFGGEEITAEQERFMSLVVHDTGRTFAPLTGGLAAFLHTTALFLGLSIYQWYGRWRKVRSQGGVR